MTAPIAITKIIAVESITSDTQEQSKKDIDENVEDEFDSNTDKDDNQHTETTMVDIVKQLQQSLKAQLQSQAAQLTQLNDTLHSKDAQIAQ